MGCTWLMGKGFYFAVMKMLNEIEVVVNNIVNIRNAIE